MNCPQCQFENQDDAKFCNKCGANLEISCPDCGTLNLPGSMFCKECGSDLTKPLGSPTIDYSHPESYTPKYLAEKILTTRSSIEGERKLVSPRPVIAEAAMTVVRLTVLLLLVVPIHALLVFSVGIVYRRLVNRRLKTTN